MPAEGEVSCLFCHMTTEIVMGLEFFVHSIKVQPLQMNKKQVSLTLQ